MPDTTDQAAPKASSPFGFFARLGRVERLFGFAIVAMLLVQTVLSIVNTERGAVLDERVRDVESELRRDAARREYANLNATITKDVFAELKAIVERQNAEPKERVERLLVGEAYVSTIPDPEIRLSFKEAIKTLNERTMSSIDAELATPIAPGVRQDLLQQRARLEDIAFSLDTQQAADRREIAAAATVPIVDSFTMPSGVQWTNYDFDIFWCDQTPKTAQAHVIADEVMRLHAREPAAQARWRVRALPRLSNLRPGYRASGYEIRIASDEERPFADQLAKAANEMLHKKKIAGAFVVRHTALQTRGYISTFVCP